MKHVNYCIFYSNTFILVPCRLYAQLLLTTIKQLKKKIIFITINILKNLKYDRFVN